MMQLGMDGVFDGSGAVFCFLSVFLLPPTASHPNTDSWLEDLICSRCFFGQPRRMQLGMHGVFVASGAFSLFLSFFVHSLSQQRGSF
jgi:hypothetical protein